MGLKQVGGGSCALLPFAVVESESGLRVSAFPTCS
jgi:hypothetical protein